MDFDKLSRRNFLKKTTVLCVGISSATLVNNLALADDENPFYYWTPQPDDCSDVPIEERASNSTTQASPWDPNYFEGPGGTHCRTNFSCGGRVCEGEWTECTAFYPYPNETVCQMVTIVT